MFIEVQWFKFPSVLGSNLRIGDEVKCLSVGKEGVQLIKTRFLVGGFKVRESMEKFKVVTVL